MTASVRAWPIAPIDESVSDETLVRRILAGEKLLFAVVMRRYNRRLFRTARAIVREDGEAEDVVQHAYVAAYDKLPRYRGSGSFGGWLNRITVNEAYTRLRNRNHRGELSVLEGGQSIMSESDPEDEAYRRELGKVLEGQIDELSENLRIVFVLRDVQELNTKETAALLNTSEEAVRIRLHRARHQLQQRLAEVMVAAPEAFPFAGERCDRMVENVLRRLAIYPNGGTSR